MFKETAPKQLMTIDLKIILKSLIWGLSNCSWNSQSQRI